MKGETWTLTYLSSYTHNKFNVFLNSLVSITPKAGLGVDQGYGRLENHSPHSRRRSKVLLVPHLMCLPPVLEVHQFAQEAVVADAWLTAQEPLLQSRELGSSVDEVEQLIRRHEAFRKAAAAWEERFSSLRRLTTVRPQIPPTSHLTVLLS